MYVNSIEEVMTFYPELTKEDIKLSWSKRYHRRMILTGFKFCSGQDIMIKTKEPTCRMCGKRFRTQIKSRVFDNGLYRETTEKYN